MAKRPEYSSVRATAHQGGDAAALEAVKAIPGANVVSVLDAVTKLWADFKPGPRPAAKIEQKRSQKIRDDAHALAAEIRGAKRSPSRQEHLAALERIEAEAEESAAYWGLKVREHSRRADPDRKLLCWKALQIWTRDAGGDLTAGIDKNGNASLAIQFLLAVVGPMLGDRTPSKLTARDIVREEQARRRPSKKYRPRTKRA
jgi:hypothetical protein